MRQQIMCFNKLTGFKTILIFCGMFLIITSNSYASLDLNFNLDQPFGTVTPTEDIVVTATLINLAYSTENLIFNSTGTRVNGFGPIGSATIITVPQSFSLAYNYGGDPGFNFYEQFANLTLMPGDSFNMIVRKYVAPTEGVALGTYGPDQILFYIGTMQYTDNISRTVISSVAPEPISSFLFVTGGMLLAGRSYIKRKRMHNNYKASGCQEQ